MAESGFEKFKNNWQQQIDKLENQVLDAKSAHLIYLSFDRDRAWLKIGMQRTELTHERLLEMRLIESRLITQLGLAKTRYLLKRKSAWARFAEALAGILYRIPKKPSTTA